MNSPNDQPVNNVRWVDPAMLRGNDYNPNQVAPPELRLLKISLLEDGWTQPIVVRDEDDGTAEIVDGYHRWTLATTDADVRALTGGLVPIVSLNPADQAHQRMSTIRHNRARGQHHVVKMADIVGALADAGIDDQTIGRRLQMEREEVTRLRERGNMAERAALPAFTRGWAPSDGDVDEAARRENRRAEAAAATKGDRS